MDTAGYLQPFLNLVDDSIPIRVVGKVSEVIGLLIESVGPTASIGDVCLLERSGMPVGRAEVVGFRKNRTLLMPLGTLEGIHPGIDVVSTKKPLTVGASKHLLGRVLDGLGQPLDGKEMPVCETARPVMANTPNPLMRRRISERFETGVRAIDGFASVGKGQRMGIFSGSGVGKSVLMGMMARNCVADVNVIALVGERGREVREFIERDLGEEGLKKSVVIVATSDQPALIRLKGSLVAATIAEYFRDCGKDVFFLIDSITRLAIAQREIGLAVGEPPATKGYTPSVFALMPKLLERAGTSESGTITGMFTVLVESDDMDEPVADAARSILDGHIVLSRQLAHRNHYPAIDILQSISRCMPDVISAEHAATIARLKDYMAAYAENEDLIQIGAYVNGTNERVDKAIALHRPLETFLRQERTGNYSFDQSAENLQQILALAEPKT
ncbi:MAG: FliI/YscN family ATPase [Chitinivibrionales bacterium]|nr:FliI/YscN family ATPase [Chitinivibrionales bacterium]